jgi:hypothetical protein
MLNVFFNESDVVDVFFSLCIFCCFLFLRWNINNLFTIYRLFFLGTCLLLLRSIHWSCILRYMGVIGKWSVSYCCCSTKLLGGHLCPACLLLLSSRLFLFSLNAFFFLLFADSLSFFLLQELFHSFFLCLFLFLLSLKLSSKPLACLCT